ncbi:MAG TPA: efflux transporter outer membrane subunit [Candidatus Acidoferrales bacterium]|nr:efflux transporter outer membrane subunit [Candidatus Acidoferrales bacterium]
MNSGVKAGGAVCGVCLVGLLSGCAVGPDFVRPAAPDVKTYTAGEALDRLSPGAGETEQRFIVGQEISAEWWELFRSSDLSAAVQQAIAGNQTLAVAEATLARAQEALTVARAAFYPQINAAANALRQQTSASRSAVQQTSTFNVFSLGPSVSYSPDVFGGTRRQVEQQAALAENQDYQLAAAYLTLTGNAVSQAINIAGTRLQIKTTEELVADDDKNLSLVRTKFDVGKAARTDVLTAETQLANDRALLPPLRQQLSVARHALSVLLGKFPAEWSPPDFDLAQLTLPGELPVSLPSELVHQRPDILAAEAQLHAASAAIGVATAQMYPSITLSASVGQQALTPDALFQGSSTVWSLASGLTAPIFQGGALTAQRREAVDAYTGSLATYRQTVLQAFDQVADTLDALAYDADLVADERRALDLADASLDLQRLSYGEGKSDLLQLLDSERLDQQARLGYARAQAQRFQDTAQLFVAMGGRWWKASLGPLAGAM